MEQSNAQSLSERTSAFYREVSASFSSTRQAPWQGWERVLQVCSPGSARELDVLDLACGNLRFERFLAEKTACAVDELHVWAVDNCDELVDSGRVLLAQTPIELSYQHLDLASHPSQVEVPLCDLTVCFGFMHHLPTAEQRARVMQALIQHTKPQGYVAVSFWQFEKDPRIVTKATPLETPGDYLLGWQDRTDVARYCHSFSESEIDELVAQVSPDAREVTSFSADGKTGDLNRYVVLRR